MRCQDVREEAAVALLTREPFGDELVAHLGACDACAGAVDDLRAVPDLLALAPSAASAADDDAGDLLLLRLLRRVIAERRRRRLSLVAVAAAVLLLLGGAVASFVSRPASVEPDVVAQAVLHPVGTSSVVEVTVAGVEEGTSCTVSAVTTSGTRYEVATWTAEGYDSRTVSGMVPVRWKDVASVELVESGSGHVLVSVPKPPVAS